MNCKHTNRSEQIVMQIRKNLFSDKTLCKGMGKVHVPLAAQRKLVAKNLRNFVFDKQ